MAFIRLKSWVRSMMGGPFLSDWRVLQVELSGGEILVQCLKEEGVEILFGYPGGAVLHIYDALYSRKTSSMCWCVMSRARCTWPMAMRVPRDDPE